MLWCGLLALHSAITFSSAETAFEIGKEIRRTVFGGFGTSGFFPPLASRDPINRTWKQNAETSRRVQQGASRINNGRVEHWFNGGKILEYDLGSAAFKELTAKVSQGFRDSGTQFRRLNRVAISRGRCVVSQDYPKLVIL